MTDEDERPTAPTQIERKWREKMRCTICGRPATRMAIAPDKDGVYQLVGHFCEACLEASENDDDI
jgi:hypothetical protein